MTLHPSTLARNSSPGYKVDISRGQRIGRVSSEWLSRPDDERYLSLSDLYDAVRARAETATAHTVETRAIRVVATPDEPERLSLLLPDREAPVAPTHWSATCGELPVKRLSKVQSNCTPTSAWTFAPRLRGTMAA